ncbi:MAG: transglutaminase family protein [Bacteroidales bacterium]|nr:transglutaminase family protein [Bacteroidales bacterium]
MATLFYIFNKKMMTNKETRALISLLEDPDREVFNVVSDHLISQGVSILPILEESLSYAKTGSHAERIEYVQQRVHFSNVLYHLTQWEKDGASDLLQGLLIICRYRYPMLTMEEISDPINHICSDIWLEMHDDLNALEKVALINNVLYEVYGFSGGTRAFPSIFDTHINVVLSQKKGSAVVLAILYLIIAQKLNLPVEAFRFADRVLLLGYLNAAKENKNDNKKKILFYIHPFSKGIVFGKSELEHVMNEKDISPDRSFTTPCSYKEILMCLLFNLSAAYEQEGMHLRLEDTKKMIDTLMS